MTITQLIKRLNMTKKPELQRELILEAWQSCDNFFVGLQLSCDPTTVIPVTKIPEIDFDDGSESEFTFSDFITLYDKVTQVGVDPAEAREFIIEAAMVADFTEWNTFYRRILLKKLQEDLPMDVITKVLAELTGLQKVL